MKFSFKNKRIWVAGHRGMVGSALIRRLQVENCEILTVAHDKLDLTRQDAVELWLSREKPDAIILSAAKVGGIHANSTYPAEFIYDNLMIASNIINSAHKSDINTLLFLGSSCIYPRLAPQPIPESALLSGPLEPTNEWYAIAKIAGIKLCQAYCKQYGRNFMSAMPTNLYGPGDNFHPQNSHVPAALLQRFHDAKENQQETVAIWGTGTPKREFLHVDDLADACTYILQNHRGPNVVNIGSGDEVSIADFAQLIAETTGYKGRLEFDSSKPDGMPRKLLDSSLIRQLGWKRKISLRQGLSTYYTWFIENIDVLRR